MLNVDASMQQSDGVPPVQHQPKKKNKENKIDKRFLRQIVAAFSGCCCRFGFCCYPSTLRERPRIVNIKLLPTTCSAHCLPMDEKRAGMMRLLTFRKTEKECAAIIIYFPYISCSRRWRWRWRRRKKEWKKNKTKSRLLVRENSGENQ